jgi:ATP-dependent 26S proteasome regulatory subunit
MTKEELKKEAEEYSKKATAWLEDREPLSQEDIKIAYLAGAEPREKQIAELEAQIEKMKKYAKLLQDICDVMGNDPYMVWRGLEQRVLILWDKSEEEKGLKMADDILERLLKISAIDWAEIEKWEIKEK